MEAVVLAVVGHPMEGLVVDRCADPRLVQQLDQACACHTALGVEDNPEEVPGVDLQGSVADGKTELVHALYLPVAGPCAAPSLAM